MKFLVLTVLLISFFIGIYYFYSKYEVIKKGNKYKPDKTEIVFRGPCDGILRLAGKGNYIKRAAENMLQTTFTDDEIKEIKRLTKLPKNIQPLDTDVSLAMRVA
ncbi:hypothetical protein LLG96_19995, partial [bacterium]|nr:hypothetical protein [bacterium]